MNASAIVSVRLAMLLVIAFAAGCVERKLTITTEPSDAVVWLNDEEIGAAPVTVNFKWYGDYKIRIQKSGYEILDTHQKLDAPAYDHFPLDLFAALWPGTFRHHPAWHFDLESATLMTNEELLEQSEAFRSQVDVELQGARQEIQQTLSDK